MALRFLVLLLVFAPVAVSQQDFLSIDCGHDANYSGYTDKITGIFYVSDGSYIDAGENHRIAPDLEAVWWDRSQTLRSFPSGERNCYALPTVAGTKYLVRAEFTYGNYDGKNSSSLQFDLHLGANYWQTVYPNAWSSYAYEAIFVAWAGWAPWCLVNTGHGTPFVSVLELRPLGRLGDALYQLVTPRLVISVFRRINMGAGVSVVRYPDDPYDRFWWPMENASPGWVNLSTTRPIQPDRSDYAVPSRILQTAVAASGNDTALTAITWQYKTKYSFMMLQHFADFQDTQLRQFDILINEKDGSGRKLKSYSPPYLASQTVYTESYRANDGRYNITLVCTNASVLLPPMINALEIYVRVPYENPTTLPSDFRAIYSKSDPS
ncbi:probable LRR receptor-like serine/threonine-protein kinase At1g05700 [Sorghum bicolor]|uniref:probable LRR receptor-like serine/threonine-protein kinase At1g05700 n=1 Tax=Sorghum bicolor TaxID=4558 RepID=UPI000B425E9A|nr:probable LRR receptor-like serine/threonine-protein kinase At1g05700 [Sorghum bicolor]|eukprot:XP_002462264.2 probable LRR receptor-like serine/threonine-protein kinase At1g05700 [Sorghum bicolor]